MKQRLSLVVLIAAVVVGVLSIGLSAVSAQNSTASNGAWLGVQISAADNGAKVELVADASPAAEAGLEVGDIISAVDGTAVTFHELHAAIMSKAAGDKLSLTVLRGEETLTIEVTLAERPAEAGVMMQPGQGMGGDMGQGGMGGGMMQAVPLPEDMQACMDQMMQGNMPENCAMMGGMMDMGQGMMMMGGHGMVLGIEYTDLNETSVKEYNASQTSGALVIRVLTGSAAEKAGLLGQDVIVAINGEAVDAEHLLTDRLNAYEAGDEITIDVVRAGETQQIKVTLEAMSMSGMMEAQAMPGMFFFNHDGMGMGGMNGMGHGSMGGGMGMGQGSMGGSSGSSNADTTSQGANT